MINCKYGQGVVGCGIDIGALHFRGTKHESEPSSYVYCYGMYILCKATVNGKRSSSAGIYL